MCLSALPLRHRPPLIFCIPSKCQSLTELAKESGKSCFQALCPCDLGDCLEGQGISKQYPSWWLVFSYWVVSESLWPHELQPVRLLCSWNSPGKNTGVGCHFLLSRWSSLPRNRTQVSCPGKQILYHGAIREAPPDCQMAVNWQSIGKTMLVVWTIQKDVHVSISSQTQIRILDVYLIFFLPKNILFRNSSCLLRLIRSRVSALPPTLKFQEVQMKCEII